MSIWNSLFDHLLSLFPSARIDTGRGLSEHRVIRIRFAC
jgi:hypothetical protein